MLPSTDQSDKDKIKRLNLLADAKHEKAEQYYKAKREHDRKLQLTPRERFAAAEKGLRKMARKHAHNDDAKRATRITTCADEITASLKVFDKLTRQLQEKRPDPRGDALESAAKELMKQLPKCFPSHADALVYARSKLPLLKANAEAVKIADKYGKVSRSRMKEEESIWKFLREGGALAFTDWDEADNLKKLIDLGS